MSLVQELSFSNLATDPQPNDLPILILHIGPPKTGALTLQKRLFSCLEGINYLKDSSLFLSSSLPPSYTSDKKVANLIKKRIYLYSEPQLWVDIFKQRKVEVLDKVKELSKKYQLKVLVTARKQSNLIISIYHHLRRLFDKKEPNYQKREKERVEFKKIFSETLKKNPHSFITDKSLDYLHIYNTFKSFLPSKNLLILPMEGILSKDPSYKKMLLQFITQRNATFKDKQLLNKLHVYKDNTSPQQKPEYQITQLKSSEYIDQIFELYKISNETLQNILSIDFKEFGYF